MWQMNKEPNFVDQKDQVETNQGNPKRQTGILVQVKFYPKTKCGK